MSSVRSQRNNGRRNFQVFYNKKRPEIARKYPFLGAKQIQRKVEALWRSLSPFEKEGFCVVSPSVADNFSQSTRAWQDEESLTPSFRTGELERPSYGSYHDVASTTAPDDDVTSMLGDEEEQQYGVDVHHSVTNIPLVRTTTWKKKPYSPLKSYEKYLPRPAGNRTQASSRSKGLLTLHMARMQMVATTAEGIGKGEFTRSSNSESEGIFEDWFDQDTVTEQPTENKQSYIGDDTQSSDILTTNYNLSEKQNRRDESLPEESTEFVNKDGCFKDVTEEGDEKDEDNNVERNEDVQYTLSQETKRAITQYLSGNGLHGTFNTSASDDEKEEGETKILIESAIDSLETDLLGDNENTGTAEKGQGKDTSNNAESAHDRIGSILSEIINEVAQNADPHIATNGEAVKHWQQTAKENIKVYDYDPVDNRSKSEQVMDGIFPTASDEARESGSDLWDRMFRNETPLKSKRKYTRKRSSSFSESGDAWEVETAAEMWLTGHSDRQQTETYTSTGDNTDMDGTSAKEHTPCSSGDVNTNRLNQNATQDSDPSTEQSQRECFSTVNEENNTELRTREDVGIAVAAKVDICKLTPSSVMGGKEPGDKVEEDNQCIIDEAGTVHAHQVTQSTPSHWEQPATSNVSHQTPQGGEHSMEQHTGNNLLPDPLHLKSAPMDIPTESEHHVDKQITGNSSGDETYSTKTKRRGIPRPAESTMVRLLTRDYNITTRAQSAGKRNTRSKVLDYRRLSGMKDRGQKTPSKRNWQRSNSKDSILSCDSGQSLRTPRQRGKKRKRQLSTSSVGSDFSTTSSVPELQENHQWEEVPPEECEKTSDQTKKGVHNLETKVKEDFCIQQDRIIGANVSPVAVCHPSVRPVDFDEQIDEKDVQNSQETRTPQSKETVDPDRQHEEQEDEVWDTHTEETEQNVSENRINHETVPNSSGGFLCEMFSDPKPQTEAWLPGFNRTVPGCHESTANFIDFEDDGIFL